MVDYTYKLDLDEPVEMGSRFRQEPRKGIGVQPKKEEPEADSWYDTFWGLIQGYFGDEDEAKKALGPKQPSTSYDMDDALQTLKGVNLPSRISEPVIEGAPEKFSMPKPEPFELEVDTIGNEALDRDGTRLVDVTDTEEGKLTNVKPLEELAEAVDPGTIDTSELPSGKGLMSPRLDEKGETSFYNPDVVTKEGKAGLKEAQKVLKGLGYYKSSIDGVTGANTSNAIKVYQYDNDLEVTGELDSATKKKLAEGGTSVPKPENELLASISEHEGGYGAANNGTSRIAKKFSVSGTYYSDNYNKPLTEMTVNEILNAQNGTTGKTDAELIKLDPETRAAQRNREFFAVGAYQIIPITMKKALQEGAISGDEVFSPELQDRIALQFLAGSDKPKLRDYIRGEKGASLDDAAMALAEQWASFPVPSDVRNDEGEVIATTGSSRYGSGNRALHDLTSTKNMLKSVREAFIQQVQTAVP
jgi:hypothetical protein